MKTPREILLQRHRSVEPRLDHLWDKSLNPAVAAVYDRRNPKPQNNLFLAAGWKLWRELILPNRRIWAGLACAWIVIAIVNLASSEATMQVVVASKPQSREELRALIEQRQMLAQLIGPLAEPAHTQKRPSPGPRSDRAPQIAAA